MDQYDQQQPYMQQPVEEEEIDIMEYVRKVLKEWKLVLKWCGVAVIVGLVVAFSQIRTYSTTSKLAPETSSKSSGSSLSSLASLAGVNLGSMSTSDAVYPDLYPDIVSSTPFVVDLFSVPVEFTYKKEKISTDLYTYLKEYNKTSWLGAVAQAPMKALGWFMGLFHEKEPKIEGYDNVNVSELTREQEKIAKAIRKSVSVEVDKKTSFITLSTTAQDAHVATQLCEAVSNKLVDYVTNYRTDKARNDLSYYETICQEAQDEYYAAQQRYAKYVDSNQGVVLQSVKTESERLQNDMNLAYDLYNTCAQQLQVAKFNLQKEKPVVAVLEPPVVPLKGNNSKSKTLITVVFLGACLAVVWILWGRDWIAELKSGGDKEEEKKENE